MHGGESETEGSNMSEHEKFYEKNPRRRMRKNGTLEDAAAEATEEEMRNMPALEPKTPDELAEYVASLIDRPHDYGTCVYATSLAATAAFNLVASKLGVTGFQASCADMDVIRRTRGIVGPFILLTADNMLYPQYDLHTRLSEAMNRWEDWAATEAEKKLKENHKDVHPSVIAHWKILAARSFDGWKGA